MIKFNSKTKVYQDGVFNTTYCNKYIFSPKVDKKEITSTNPNIQNLIDKANACNIPVKKISSRKLTKRGKYQESVSRDDNIKRARDKLFDIICCNNFKYFVTLTFNPDIVDSYNIDECIKKTKTWLKNNVNRKGLTYVLVPELHPTSGRLHLHACFNDVLNLVDSGHKTSDHKTVYNITDWEYGFSTAIKLTGSRCRVAWYVSKYITKDYKKLFGRAYWTSKNIIREPETNYFNSEYGLIQGQVYSSSAFSFKYDFTFDSCDDFEDICNECDDILEVLERIDKID